ncbi:hypothetical protein [Tabrizicola sp.]|uniref:hypothetical protein n=1 Tax=Tabrizicola sp. TaxID=2005166 RepID=UPI003F3F4F01
MALLEDLLDHAAEALLIGDLAALGALTPQIKTALSALTPDAATRRLRDKALRNARLLEAATRGVKAARHRLTEITRGPTLTTYNARGQKAAIAPLGPDPARRV